MTNNISNVKGMNTIDYKVVMIIEMLGMIHSKLCGSLSFAFIINTLSLFYFQNQTKPLKVKSNHLCPKHYSVYLSIISHTSLRYARSNTSILHLLVFFLLYLRFVDSQKVHLFLNTQRRLCRKNGRKQNQFCVTCEKYGWFE